MHKVKSFIKNVPGAYRLYLKFKRFYFLVKSIRSPFLYFAPPGHFYSCIPNVKEILAKSDLLFKQGLKECPGIDLRDESQLELLERLSVYYNELPFPETSSNRTRYYYENGAFSYGDVIILYSFLRLYKPRKLIEIGSGFSSAAMLDVNDIFLENTISFTFVEPHPDWLFMMLNQEDRRKHTIIQKPVQDVPLELFRSLTAGDILFIDSSHVVKIGSDVAYIFFNILPALKPGVVVHFHDVFWPFEYPKEWLLEGRMWNEAYFLRSFLQFNDTFEILYFNSFMAKFHSEIIRKKMPLCLKKPGGSLWLRKVT